MTLAAPYPTRHGTGKAVKDAAPSPMARKITIEDSNILLIKSQGKLYQNKLLCGIIS
jgi:hypothetical protein